jgi:predicted neutral ceramidase superfamily lipid hydrolase
MAAKKKVMPEMHTPAMQQANNHMDMWERHCSEAFRTMHDKLDNLEHGWQGNKVSIEKLNTLVTNGLSHKVDAIERRMWGIAGTALVTLIGVIVQLIFLVMKNNGS